MQLKVLIEATGKSWTLKPGREYLMGTSPDCDIIVESIDDSIAFIKLKFDSIGSLWHLENLQKDDFRTLLNTQRLTRSIIQVQSQLKVVGQSIVLTPEALVAQAQVNNQQYRSATSYGSSLDSIVDKAAEYAKIGLAGAGRFAKTVQAAANDISERSLAQEQIQRQQRAQARSSKQGATLIGLSSRGLSSPTDGAGIKLSNFSMATTMKVERTRVAGICERLYQHVDHKINDGMLGSAQSKIVTYTIEELRGKEARQYIQVAHNTESETRTTIFIRFLGSGDNLFLGIDVCILGELDKKAYGAMQSSTVLCILLSPITLGISLILAYSMWDKVRMRAEYEGDVALARRQEFPGPIKFDAFDEDDITIFIKTTLHAASESILEIFEAEKLPVESLDAFIKQVDSGSTTIINNNGSGSIDMRGAAVGAGSKAGYSKSVAK